LNFSKVEFGNPMLQQYPWKSWYDNFTYSIEAIDIVDGGGPYTETPLVTVVPAHGDSGFGATAIAFISLGKVNRVVVTNPGKAYTSPPTIVFNGGGSTSLTSAKAVPRLGLNNIRTNNITIKFDRVTGRREIGNTTTSDTFIADGQGITFDLTWVPVPEKSLITLTVNDVLQLVDSYNIEFYNNKYTPQTNTSYIKKYARLHLNFIPNKSDVIKIEYPKNLDFYTAIDRIEDYYEPGSGMPGKDPRQLMSGLEYAGLLIDTMPFSASGGWDVLPWGSTAWDNYSPEDGYVSFASTSTATQVFTLTNLIITTGTQVNIYLNGNRVDNTSTSALIPTITGVGSAAIDYIEITNSGTGYIYGSVTATISAPNTLGGQQAIAFIDPSDINNDGSFNRIRIAAGYQGTGYTEVPVVTITGQCGIQAYARAVLKSEFTTSTSATITEVTIPAIAFTSTSTLVEFRYATSDGTVLPTDLDSLDSVINGGDLTYTTALGLTPSEIILDGGSTATQSITKMNDDGFLNVFNSPAPEECVPGQLREAIGISVYTQPASTPPLITNRRYWVSPNSSTATNAYYRLGVKPSNRDSVIAVFNDKVLSSSSYVIDYDTNAFQFTSNTPGTGWLSLTSMQLGSTGLLEYYYKTVLTTGTTHLSTVAFADIGSDGASVYITIDGAPAYPGPDYTIGKYKNRARFTFNTLGHIQLYIFSGPVKSFSEINEQIIISTSTSSVFDLTQPPGVLAPFHSQVIVTKNGTRLKPPITSYYEVIDGQLIFDISKSITFPSRLIDLIKLEVYVNGVRSPAAGDWRLNQSDATVQFTAGTIADGDAIAIVVKNGHEYLIENNQLVLMQPTVTNDELHVTTFTNHDPDFIRTERFEGHESCEYRMQRPALDAAYVWVTYNGQPLTVNLDYSISLDGYSIIVRNKFYQGPTDSIVVTSFAESAEQLTAYRIFKDMLGRTHYKRLSSENTTVLDQDLTTTSTTITVSSSTALTMPSVKFNRPGVLLVEGERIEFFTVNGNTLGQLRRGTLGTMPKPIYLAGTSVVDQGAEQTLPFTEFIQTTATVITTSTQVNFDLTGYISFNGTAAYTDQVEVRYGGRPLLKPGLNTVVHNNDLAYDSTSTADVMLEPEFTIESTSSVLTLNFTPLTGMKLEVIARNSRIFGDNNSPVFKFLQERPAVLPFNEIGFTATTTIIYLETGEPLTDESDNPLEDY
jgi:hypothetical protein